MKPLLISVLALGWVTESVAQSETESEPPSRMPTITVTATNALAEEAVVGENQQPEWTARRRFVTTRVYVQPPWQFESETGWQATYPRDGSPRHLLTEEIELGLPYRLQLDYQYAEAIDSGHWRYDSSSVEVRWAFAEWDRILLNPTVKAEWKFNNGEADAYELSLALGAGLAPRWHWGANLFYEQQVGSGRETEYAVSQALSYTLVDDKLGLGIEMKLDDETDKDDRNPHFELLIGPSVQWRPTSRTHLDVVPLFGVTGRAPQVQTFVFFGIDFGPGSEPAEGITPASLRNK
jgi:hypothetical protein